MSLIDDALKRAQAAQGDEKRPEAARRPWTPVPLPDPGRIHRRKTIRAAVLVAVVALASLGALMLLRRTPEKGPAVLPAPTAPGPLPPGEGRGLRSRASAKEGEGKTAAKAAESGPTRAPRMAAATPVSPGSSSPVQAAPPATAPADRATALTNGKTYIASVTLPGGARIELGGIVYSESNATALVNGKIVGPGAILEGFLIQRIEESRLELSNSAGLTIYLALK